MLLSLFFWKQWRETTSCLCILKQMKNCLYIVIHGLKFLHYYVNLWFLRHVHVTNDWNDLGMIFDEASCKETNLSSIQSWSGCCDIGQSWKRERTLLGTWWRLTFPRISWSTHRLLNSMSRYVWVCHIKRRLLRI